MRLGLTRLRTTQKAKKGFPLNVLSEILRTWCPTPAFPHLAMQISPAAPKKKKKKSMLIGQALTSQNLFTFSPSSFCDFLKKKKTTLSKLQKPNPNKSIKFSPPPSSHLFDLTGGCNAHSACTAPSSSKHTRSNLPASFSTAWTVRRGLGLVHIVCGNLGLKRQKQEGEVWEGKGWWLGRTNMLEFVSIVVCRISNAHCWFSSVLCVFFFLIYSLSLICTLFILPLVVHFKNNYSLNCNLPVIWFFVLFFFVLSFQSLTSPPLFSWHTHTHTHTHTRRGTCRKRTFKKKKT